MTTNPNSFDEKKFLYIYNIYYLHAIHLIIRYTNNKLVTYLDDLKLNHNYCFKYKLFFFS